MFLFSSLLMILWIKSEGLKVSPDQSQFFRWDSVVLDCETPDLILLRTTHRDSGTRCGQGWGEQRGVRCLIQFIDPMDSGWYWCESREGQSQGGRNITVRGVFGPPAEMPHATEYTPPLDTETPPPSTETPPPAAETPPPSQRPPAVAVLCHLLVLCPYVLSTVLMLSLWRQTRSGAALGLDERADDITAVTTEHRF